MPTVSVILPTYNRLALLFEAVDSVRAQTVSDWELIVVDDGSSDESVAWLESARDDRIRVIRQAHTGHIGRLRNVGIHAARADWIAFLDSDDRWHPQKLERQLALHTSQPNVRWSYTGRVMIGADGVALPAAQFKAWEPHAGWILREVLSLEANIACPSVMVERALLLELGGFDERWSFGEDFELWVRLAECSECGLVDEPLVDVRSHKGTTFGQPDVNLGLARMYDYFAGRTVDPELRAIARRRQAIHAIGAAHTLTTLERWTEASASIFSALRVRPFNPNAYLAAMRLLKRRLATARAAEPRRRSE